MLKKFKFSVVMFLVLFLLGGDLNPQNLDPKSSVFTNFTTKHYFLWLVLAVKKIAPIRAINNKIPHKITVNG